MSKNVRDKFLIFAGFVFIVLAITVTIFLNQNTPRLAIFWILGIIIGFVLSRSRLCFVSGFSNFYLFRDGEMLKAIIAGMIVATIGFALIMHGWVSDPATGSIPPGAHVSPFGWYLIPAGLLFGFGMIIAGCCITGSLYRLAGGFVYAFIALVGVILGMGAFLFTKELLWADIADLPRIWLPKYMGWPGAVIFTLVLLIASYFWVRYLQIRHNKKSNNISFPEKEKRAEKQKSSGLKSFGSKIIGNWPIITGGVLLGILNILLYYLVDRPWGVTGEIQRWSQIIFDFAGFSVPEITPIPGT